MNVRQGHTHVRRSTTKYVGTRQGVMCVTVNLDFTNTETNVNLVMNYDKTRFYEFSLFTTTLFLSFTLYLIFKKEVYLCPFNAL